MSKWRDNGLGDALSWAPPRGSRLAAASFIKRRFPIIGNALGAGCVIPLECSMVPLDGVVGWGGRLQARLARRYAAIRRLKYWSVEDGFLRSIGLGKARYQPLSILVDDLGLHHNPIAESRLEKLLLQGSASPDIAHARDIRARLIEENLTKYNSDDDNHVRLPRATKSKRILIIDQVANDASTSPYGTAAFGKMLTDAKDQNAEILIRSHPDVLAGFSSGALQSTAQASGSAFLDGGGPIQDVLSDVDEVWTVSSQFGFEALMRGQRVVTYGMPFYAGWGLTEDRATDAASSAARQRRKSKAVGIDELVAAALLRYPIYFDPIKNRRISIDCAIDRLSSWRREFGRFRGRYVCVNFSRHKHEATQMFLGTPWSKLSFTKRRPPDNDRDSFGADKVFWGRTELTDQLQPALTIEDGFIRSVGLGSGKIPPRSLCIDPIGIYYDATRPSLLEAILNGAAFSNGMLDRATRLRELIVRLQLTKYNVSLDRFEARTLRTSRPIALVAEQVPNDASLRFGMPVHQTSLALLAAVRETRPDHFIVFKRHPDILARARPSNCTSSDYRRFADHVLDRNVDMSWSGIEECHSATSQLGFEALLRGVKTYCHGVPFYSGWGLTTDSVTLERRHRRLSIDQLVAGVLIVYPSYRCWKSRLPCEPEDVIRDIVRERSTLRHQSGFKEPLR